MGDDLVDSRACRYVARSAHLVLLIGTEQSRVMSLLDDHEGYSRLIRHFQLDAGLSDCSQLVIENVEELALADAVAIVDDACRFEPCRLVELDQQFFDHRCQILDGLLTMRLHTDRGSVPAWMSVHTADYRCDTRFRFVSRWRMSEIGPEEDNRLFKYGWTNTRHENTVDSAEFHVDLQTEVGKCLWRRFIDIFRLNTLSSQAEYDIADTFDFSCQDRTR